MQNFFDVISWYNIVLTYFQYYGVISFFFLAPLRTSCEVAGLNHPVAKPQGANPLCVSTMKVKAMTDQHLDQTASCESNATLFVG